MKASIQIVAFLVLIIVFSFSSCEKEDPDKFDVTCNITFIIHHSTGWTPGCHPDVELMAWIDGYPDRLIANKRAIDCRLEWYGLDFRVNPDDKIIVSANAGWGMTFGRFKGWDYIDIVVDEELTDFSGPNVINKLDTIFLTFNSW